MNYQELGQRIDEAWGGVYRDERKFPDIAFEALSRFEPNGFDLNDIGRLLLTTPIRQQPETEFSNLPVTVYRGDSFHLELLIWTRASTSVHQHGFSGAFRVIAGSSLHSDYRFIEAQRLNSHLLIGQIEMIRMRLLSVGDVIPILSGREGLVHSLFHLDEPSVTLVARTSWEPEAGPQYSLIQPGFAFDSLWADADERLAILHRWFGVIDDIGDQTISEFVLDRLVELDSPRLFAIVVHHAARFSEEVFQGNFLEKLRDRHPHLVDSLSDVARIKRHQLSLSATRKQIKNPNLRFLIALLLNARSRGQILDMIRAREPHIDPETRCVDWLLQLGDPDQIGVALRERSPFLLRLSMALDAAGDSAQGLVEALVRGNSLERSDLSPEALAPGRHLLHAHRALRTAPELSPLCKP